MMADSLTQLRSLIDMRRPAANRELVRDAASFVVLTDKSGAEHLYPVDDGKTPLPSGEQLSGLPYEQGNGDDDLTEVPEGPGDNIDPLVILTQQLSARMLEMLQTPIVSGLPYQPK